MAPGGGVAAIVPAAGASRRFGGATSKSFARLRGLPLLVHALHALQANPSVRWIVPVVRAGHEARVARLLRRHRITKALPPRAGGASRAESVAIGFAAVPPQAGWVLVHDGARPCVSRRLIADAIRAARHHGAVACGLPASLTVKAVDQARAVLQTLDRDALWFVQTPQVFRRAWLAHALARANGTLRRFPDDAAVLEAAGFPVRMIPGDPLNLKVTTSDDLMIAETILARRERRAVAQ